MSVASSIVTRRQAFKRWLAGHLYRWVLRLDHREAGERGAIGVVALLVHYHGGDHIVIPDSAFASRDLELEVWRDVRENSTHYRTRVTARAKRMRFLGQRRTS